MLSISNVSANQAASYYAKDGYYARMDNDGDHWFGNLQKELNLPYNLTKEDFDLLIHGKKERAGYDLCFSAPKSVSIALALGDEIREDMLEAHNAAVIAVLSRLEEREIGARVTKDGVTKHIKTGKMLAGCFNHYVSRNSDPQLHTHCVVLNKTECKNQYYAVDNSDLYKNKLMYGQLYRNILARNLMGKGYAVNVTDPEKGFFELSGISQEAIDKFSSRRREIVEKLKEWGNNTPAAASVAAVLTRKAKEHKDMNVLIVAWRQTLEEKSTVNLIKSENPIISTLEQQRKKFDQAVECLEKKSFAWSAKELKKAALAAGVASGMTEATFEKLVKEDEGNTLVALGSIPEARNKENYYTTKQNLQTEKEIFQEVVRTKNSMIGLNVDEVKEFLKKIEPTKTPLPSQQWQAVIDIVTTKDQYIAVQGLAGTGKTHMLSYVRQVMENEGYVVKGACFTGKAAQGLEADAKIPAQTIHSLLNGLEREAGNAKSGEDMLAKAKWDFAGLAPSKGKEVWVIDEAGMVANNIMRNVMEAAKIKGAKVVLVGDQNQLLPVGVGNAFSVMVATGKIEVIKLDEIRRQKNQELLGAVREAVKGDVRKSLELIQQDIKVIEKHAARIEAIVADYTALTPQQQNDTIVLTAANKDRHALNEAIRGELINRGCLATGTEFKVEDAAGNIHQRNVSVGDKMIFLQNDNRLGVRNGQTGLITKIEGNVINIKSGEKEIEIDLDRYKKIDHGYCLTTHKAQGVTADRVLIHLDSSQKQLNSRNAYYVDISRARHQVKVYVDNLENVQNQIKEFAKKVTSEDFLIATALEKKNRANIFQKSLAVKNLVVEKFQALTKGQKPEMKRENKKTR